MNTSKTPSPGEPEGSADPEGRGGQDRGGPSRGDLRDAQRALEQLQEEHRPILERVGSDPGMSEATRRMLLEHLEEEEHEHEQRVAELRARSREGPKDAGAETPPPPPLPTVGSLRRPASGAPAEGGGTVGSLRPR